MAVKKNNPAVRKGPHQGPISTLTVGPIQFYCGVPPKKHNTNAPFPVSVPVPVVPLFYSSSVAPTIETCNKRHSQATRIKLYRLISAEQRKKADWLEISRLLLHIVVERFKYALFHFIPFIRHSGLFCGYVLPKSVIPNLEDLGRPWKLSILRKHRNSTICNKVNKRWILLMVGLILSLLANDFTF